MLSRPYPLFSWQGSLQFWLAWVLASSLGSAGGFVCGVLCAYIASALLVAVAGHIAEPIMLLALILGPALGGLLIGAVVGPLQAKALPWSEADRARWRIRSAVSWCLGAAFGFPLALAVVALLFWYTSLSDLRVGLPLTEVTAAWIGLALGIGLRPALPLPPPNLGLWVAGHVAATSIGWTIARLFDLGLFNIGLSWTGLVLGPLVYAMVTGTMMLWLERRRLAPATANGHTPS